MDPISVTLSQGGRPFLTTRLRSVTFDGPAKTQGSEQPAQTRTAEQSRTKAPSQASDSGPGFSVKRADGFGDEALRNLFLSKTQATAANASDAPEATGKARAPEESADGLTDAEREQVDKLRARDAEVRRHEQAHAAVGGQYAGAPSYTYQQGPDGRRYAIGGEVQIDVAPVAGDPEATIEKMGVVKAAALAPAEPSSADRRVAALADAQRLQAVSELATLRTEERLEVFNEASADRSATADNPFPGEAFTRTDTRFADAAGLLSLGEDDQPGQKLNTAA